MDEVEFVNQLNRLQFGGLKKVEADKIRLAIKKQIIKRLRGTEDPELIPLSMGWYLALILEDPKPKENAFILIRDKTYFPGNRSKATFAVAWSHDYLEQMREQERFEEYGFTETNIILQENFRIKDSHIKQAVKTYGPLVKALNNKEFHPDSISAPFYRYAIDYVRTYKGTADTDVYFEARLKDNTLIQYFRDGNFRAYTPGKVQETEHTHYESWHDTTIPPKKSRLLPHHKT
jgi:hypothetical protein